MNESWKQGSQITSKVKILRSPMVTKFIIRYNLIPWFIGIKRITFVLRILRIKRNEGKLHLRENFIRRISNSFRFICKLQRRWLIETSFSIFCFQPSTDVYYKYVICCLIHHRDNEQRCNSRVKVIKKTSNRMDQTMTELARHESFLRHNFWQRYSSRKRNSIGLSRCLTISRQF